MLYFSFPNQLWEKKMKVNEEDKSRIIYWQEKECCLYLSHAWLFCDPMDCSLPGSPVCGTLQARMLQWAAILLQGMESESLALQADSLSHLLTSQALHPFHLIFPYYSLKSIFSHLSFFLFFSFLLIAKVLNAQKNHPKSPNSFPISGDQAVLDQPVGGGLEDK